jgi:hypothetical protein
MNNFYEFIKNYALNEVLKLSSAKKVRKQIRKFANYKPGTFGIELEFPAGVNDDVKEQDLENPFIPDNIKYNHTENTEILTSILEKYNQDVAGEQGSENSWGIGPDFANTEMRSKYLTTKDIPDLLDILNEIKRYTTKGVASTIHMLNGKIVSGTTQYLSLSPRCSAHVHIGLQQFDDMNAFDALAMLQLIDEKSAYEVAGEDRDRYWTRKKGTVINVILHKLYTKGLIKENLDFSNIIVGDSTMKAIFDFAKDGLNKYSGTNLKSFVNNGTIEFRYLSSQIIMNPEKFIEMIQYYLMLPRLARSKMQLKFTEELQGVFSNLPNEIYFTRLAGNRIRISQKAVPYEKGSIADTRKDLPLPLLLRFEMKKNQNYIDYLKDKTVGELRDYLFDYFKKNEVPDFFDSSHSAMQYAKNNNLNRNAVFIGDLFRINLNLVNAYADKKLNDVYFFEYPVPSVLDKKLFNQPFDSGLSSLGKICKTNYKENFERLYKFLFDTKAFG